MLKEYNKRMKGWDPPSEISTKKHHQASICRDTN